VPFLRTFLYDLSFCRYKALKSPTTFSKFRLTLRTRLPDTFHHLVPDDFHCQAPLKNATCDLFGSEKCQLANLVENRDTDGWKTDTGHRIYRGSIASCGKKN